MGMLKDSDSVILTANQPKLELVHHHTKRDPDVTVTSPKFRAQRLNSSTNVEGDIRAKSRHAEPPVRGGVSPAQSSHGTLPTVIAKLLGDRRNNVATLVHWVDDGSG